jgi:AcrR family transcriptional regulator
MQQSIDERNPLVNSGIILLTSDAMARPYISQLRRDQYQTTRVRIIEAVARVLARGVTELSVPAVAEEAGVSVATVYRHFPTKADLVAALRAHIFIRIEASPADFASGKFGSLDEVLDQLPKVALRWAQVEPAVRTASTSGLVDEYRSEHRAERLEPIELALRRERPDLSPDDLTRLRDVVAVLASSPGLRAFEVLTGLSAEEAGATIAWAIRRLLRSP